MMKEEITNICIDFQSSIISSLKQMDAVRHKLLIVLKDNIYYNLLSIGDVQRAIIKGIDLNKPVNFILRSDTKVASIHDDIQQVKDEMKQRKNEFMPIIDDSNNLIDVIFWEDLFKEKNIKNPANLDLPVVIMAGGKGERLKPLTNILPKPLIPIGEQTMMEDIMDRFIECGCDEFFVSVNYKADTIRRYFNDLSFGKKYNITFFQEEKPLGTGGSLFLLRDKITKPLFVSNCDIIIDEDYSEIYKYHQTNKNEITVVAALRNISLPYGTLETGDEGLLQSIQEKPNFVFKINTGMYIIEPHLLNEIPANTFYHITFLIEKLLKQGRRVGVFPINDGSWTDIGNWNEYLKRI